MSANLRVLGIGIATPDHQLDATASKSLLREMFNPPDRVMSVIEHQQVQMRRVIREASWYTSGASYSERNAVAVSAAEAMTEKASKEAFDNSRVNPNDIAAIVMVTSTVVSMPGLENRLIGALGLRPSVLRVPVWGRGCTGGVVGVNLGARLSESFAGQPVLVVVVDCCTANVQTGDRSLTNILISALYADGAAAILVGSGTEGPEILGSRSTVVPGTAELGGWDVVPNGLRYRHHTSITAIATEWIPSEVLALREAHGFMSGNPGTVILQPANADALQNQSDAMNLSENARELNFNNLRTRGNLSAPAVLFALHDLISEPNHAARPTVSGPFTLVGTGPGYSIEQLLLRW
jgi:alkylresorcinol/alkylpyrone synthase